MTMTTSLFKARRKTSSGKRKTIKSDIRLTRPPRTEQEYLPLSLHFPYPPLPTPSNLNFSPLSSPSSTSSGLPATPPETSPSSSPILKAQMKLPLTIAKRDTNLSFGNFFSAPLSPTSSDEESFEEPVPSFASPMYPLVSRSQHDPFIIIPPLTPLYEHDEDDPESPRPSDPESDDDYYTNALSSLLTLTSRIPQQNQNSSTRPESMLSPSRYAISNSPLDDQVSNFEQTHKNCFPSAQLDPAWGRRSFLIPTRPPPPPPTASLPHFDASPSSSPSPPTIRTSRPRPPSLMIAKPLPRMSVVPLDTVAEDDGEEGASLLSYYGLSPSYSAFSSSSSSSEASLDDFELQFEMDLESDLKFPLSLPGSPSETEADDEDEDDWMTSETGGQLSEQVMEQDSRSQVGDHEQPGPALRSRWSSSTLSSIHHLQSPRTPSTVSKFKHYLRGSISSKKEGSSPRKGKRGVVVLGPSASSTAPFSPGARSTRFTTTPMSPLSTTSSFSFGSPTSPTFSDAGHMGMMSFSAISPSSSPVTKPPVPTSPKPTRVRRRPSTSSSSNSSTMSSGSERLRRKPIPVEMFLRV
ncbi:hypothetical protein L218DRAFT_1075695 [Marasmius fiardii PR-910]|nr:hypothetical protein L218DRAFT_1075695 [Marasmius fiardii PR-910]